MEELLYLTSFQKIISENRNLVGAKRSWKDHPFQSLNKLDDKHYIDKESLIFNR